MSMFDEKKKETIEELEKMIKEAIEEYVETELENVIEKAVLKALQKYYKPLKVTEKDFDRVYKDVADSFGLARLDAIRKQLGMTEEEFYGRFRDHILQNYIPIQGGQEGLILHGVLYGIVKSKNWEKQRLK